VASVESGALPPNGSATFDLTLPSRQESCFYRIVVDASGSEFESLESNNTADTPPFGP